LKKGPFRSELSNANWRERSSIRCTNLLLTVGGATLTRADRGTGFGNAVGTAWRDVYSIRVPKWRVNCDVAGWTKYCSGGRQARRGEFTEVPQDVTDYGCPPPRA
jgi:hypothetical protein